jgi:ubiquinone/menaquinone biosynthesis C-methylase UbiE
MGYVKEQASKEFERWSETYDQCVLQWLLFGPSHRVLIGRIRALVGNARFRLLDVGCGTGVFAARVREEFARSEVWGVDLVASMLSKGRHRWNGPAGRAIPVQGDSERLPFATGSFDLVTSSNSFHHYPRQDVAIQEMRRVLRPGGRLLIIDGYRDGPWGWFIYDFCVASIEGEVHHASARRFRELMAQAGFQAIAQRVHRGPAPFLLSEGIAGESAAGIPSPHFHLRDLGRGEFLAHDATAE